LLAPPLKRLPYAIRKRNTSSHESYLRVRKYGGTAPKFCRFHKTEVLPLPPVEHTKLGSCTENKITRQVYLLCGTKEVWENNCHYREITTRKENRTSLNQFKSVKLLRKPLIQSQPREQQRREKIQPQRKPNLAGCPTN